MRPALAKSMLLPITIVFAMLQGCGAVDELGNVDVVVENETDRIITVKFTTAVSPWEREERTTIIPPGEQDVLKVYEYSDITAIYNEMPRVYGLDCPWSDITGSCETITVRVSDFT